MFFDGAAEAFMKLQLAYTEWNSARALQGWSHPPVSSLVPVNSASLRPSDRFSSHNEGRGSLCARTPLASQTSRPGVPQQQTGAASASSGVNSANFSQNAGANPEQARDNIFYHFSTFYLFSQPQ